VDLLRVDLPKSARRALENPLLVSKWNARAENAKHRVVVFGSKHKSLSAKPLTKVLSELAEDWQLETLTTKSAQSLLTRAGTLHILSAGLVDAPETDGHGQRLKISDFSRMRDLIGGFWRTQKFLGDTDVLFCDLNDEEILGALIGVGLASYSFLPTLREPKKEKSLQIHFSLSKGNIARELIDTAVAIVTAMNLSRHLANLPASSANPETLAEFFADYFKGRPGLKVDVWDLARLKKEKMGLLLGVGHGSETGARFVHLRYRPKKSKGAPLAFVGKGVTFDTGGLDIKPSAGMRWMKKDMSGAAIVAGVCDFVTSLSLKTACDFYLPLAENAISDRATRPGDVHQSRAGHFVEIDNTDAEGRLVMADAIDVAVTQQETPSALIDVSTLTGAMRVAVGLDVAGFFSNNDKLAREAEVAAQKMGELAWRMPLVQKYAKSLNSSYADFKNSSDGGFGGAITAALFLEKFVGKVPWLHFDVMAWNNSADGALSDGSNAQCLQILAGMLLARE